uniref:Uncharacterized protein n=1 Tax=Romanomermis culicivorax TaxID=13658 RepID=A0A915IZT3_ROMCU
MTSRITYSLSVILPIIAMAIRSCHSSMMMRSRPHQRLLVQRPHLLQQLQL